MTASHPGANGLTGAALAALVPLREAIRHAAERDAEQLSATARDEAARISSEAAAEAERISREAAERGEADAVAEARSRSSHARRAARETVLAAQESLRLDLMRELGTAAAAARNDPRYASLLEQLRRRAAHTLGHHAALRESPDGGLVATAGTRSLDLSLPTLALRRVEEQPEEVSRLWQE